ncbi:MAG: M23 family metallopeptidase [Candidatus Dormibacteraeota bacterium]|nr:M23 family metallopeptidase [Candidatus Dormibacteraeota bacterium]
MSFTDIVEGYETQGFGCVDYSGEWYAPWCPTHRFHCGIDIGCGFRAPVRTPRAGLVVAVGIPYLGDQAVGIHADDGRYIELGHGDQALVRVGDRVTAGQAVMLADSRGASSGNHVHLEVRTDGAVQGIANQAAAVLDPTPYLHIQAPAGAATSTRSDIMDTVRILPGERFNLGGGINDPTRKTTLTLDADGADGAGPIGVDSFYHEAAGGILNDHHDIGVNQPEIIQTWMQLGGEFSVALRNAGKQPIFATLRVDPV